MSHTFEGNTCKIFYDSDFTGEVTINNDSGEIRIDCADILRFASLYVRFKRSIQLEQMTWEDILE